MEEEGVFDSSILEEVDARMCEGLKDNLLYLAVRSEVSIRQHSKSVLV